MSKLIFHTVGHVYELDGEEIPSNTTCLKEAGLLHIYPGMTNAAWRGTVVHRAVELLLKDELDWWEVPDKWWGYIESYEKWAEATGFVPLESEQRLCNPLLGVAGTRDLRGMLFNRMATIDLKTGLKEEWHKWQLAGYTIMSHAAQEDGTLIEIPDNIKDNRYTLYLIADGRLAELVPHKDQSDYAVFRSAVTITHARRSLKNNV